MDCGDFYKVDGQDLYNVDRSLSTARLSITRPIPDPLCFSFPTPPAATPPHYIFQTLHPTLQFSNCAHHTRSTVHHTRHTEFTLHHTQPVREHLHSVSAHHNKVFDGPPLNFLSVGITFTSPDT